MSKDMRDIPWAQGILLGGLFLATGLVIVFVALDWIHVDPTSIQVPRWVLGICGLIFAVPGAGIAYYGIRNALGHAPPSDGMAGEDAFPVVGWLTGMVVSDGLTAVAAWIAWGPGERAFSGSVGIGGVAVGGSGQSESVGRWVFGIGAVLVGLFTLWVTVRAHRGTIGANPYGRSPDHAARNPRGSTKSCPQTDIFWPRASFSEHRYFLQSRTAASPRGEIAAPAATGAPRPSRRRRSACRPTSGC